VGRGSLRKATTASDTLKETKAGTQGSFFFATKAIGLRDWFNDGATVMSVPSLFDSQRSYLRTGFSSFGLRVQSSLASLDIKLSIYNKSAF